MALKTINDLTALTTPASTDLVGVWGVGAARMRKSTIAQTFSPMLAVANVFSAKQTMDALLALKKNVAPGTTSGYLELGTDANGDLKVQNDAGAGRTLAGSISGGGTVATGGFTLTVPATGTAVLRNSGLFAIGYSADGDVTPSVANYNVLIIANTAPCTITNLDDGYSGQIVILYFSNGNTTISQFCYAPTPLPYTPDAYDTLTLVNIGGSWIQVSRSAN